MTFIALLSRAREDYALRLNGEVSVMGRWGIALSGALLATMLMAGTALGGTQWCVVDPIITVNGRTTDVQVSFDAAEIPTVTGPVAFVIHVPSNATATVGMPPSSVPYTVQIVRDLAPGQRKSTTVRVETTVSATDSFAVDTVVKVTRNVNVSVTGASNATTSITYTLGN
jgi:hypothetical protein